MAAKPPTRLMTDTLVIGYYEGRRLVDRRIVGPDATDNRVDTTGFALRLIDADEARLGRPRARSGAERLLRAAGFSDPGRAYAFAMDRRARQRLSEAQALDRASSWTLEADRAYGGLV